MQSVTMEVNKDEVTLPPKAFEMLAKARMVLMLDGREEEADAVFAVTAMIGWLAEKYAKYERLEESKKPSPEGES